MALSFAKPDWQGKAVEEQAFENIELRCGDCGQMFTWEAGEQKFYALKGLTTPKRCKGCRTLNKAKREQAASAQAPMGDRAEKRR